MKNMEAIKFHEANITKKEIKNVLNILDSGWLTTGPAVKKFETNFLKLFKKKLYCAAVNSCTSGLFLALKSIGIGKDDEVITTDLTFTSTVSSIYHCGAKPIIADIESGSFNISFESIKKKITKKTKCIIVVHYAGLPADIEKIYRYAKKRNIKVIEDAAHCLPTLFKGDYIGENYSDASVFSFYATKTLTTGEGGMVLSKNKKIIDYIKLNSLHGINKNTYDRYIKIKKNSKYDVINAGYKFNLTDLAASIGLGQLKLLKKNYALRKKIAQTYFKYLKHPLIDLPKKDNFEKKNSWHLFVIKITKSKTKTRDGLVKHLIDKKIGTSIHYVPIHRHSFWKKKLKISNKNFPNTEQAYNEILSLPIYPNLKKAQVKRIIKEIIDYLN